MRNTSLLLSLVIGFVFLESFSLNINETQSLTPLFGNLNNGSYTLEEVLEQDKIRISFRGSLMGDDEIRIVSYQILLQPAKQKQASLIRVEGGVISHVTRDFISKAKTGDNLIVNDIRYKPKNSELKSLNKNIVLKIL